MARITETIPTVPYGNVRIEAENVHEFRALRDEYMRVFPVYQTTRDDSPSERSVEEKIAVASEDEPLSVEEITAQLDATPVAPEVSDAKAAFLKRKKEG